MARCRREPREYFSRTRLPLIGPCPKCLPSGEFVIEVSCDARSRAEFYNLSPISATRSAADLIGDARLYAR